MKTMTCRQLGGACDEKFTANTWEEMQQKSMRHGKDMMEKGDKAHLEAGKKMRELLNDPIKMRHWLVEKKKEFEQIE
jgi:hypothetical protein